MMWMVIGINCLFILYILHQLSCHDDKLAEEYDMNNLNMQKINRLEDEICGLRSLTSRLQAGVTFQQWADVHTPITPPPESSACVTSMEM